MRQGGWAIRSSVSPPVVTERYSIPLQAYARQITNQQIPVVHFVLSCSSRGLTWGSAISLSGRRGDPGRTAASEASNGIDNWDWRRLRARLGAEEKAVYIASQLPIWNQLVQDSGRRQLLAAEKGRR